MTALPDYSNSSWFQHYADADKTWPVDDIGKAVWTDEGFGIIGYWVKYGNISDQRMVAVMVHEIMSQCVQIGGFTSRQIGNVIAIALTKCGDFHRTRSCFDGIEPQRALPPGLDNIVDEIHDSVGGIEDDDEDCDGSGCTCGEDRGDEAYWPEEDTPITTLAEGAEWLYEALQEFSGEGLVTRAGGDNSAVKIDGDFNLYDVAEYVMDRIYNIDEEER